MTYPDVTNTTVFSSAGVVKLQYGILDRTTGIPFGITGSIANGADAGMGMYIAIKEAGSAAQAPRTVNVTGENGRFLHKYMFSPEQIGDLGLTFGVANTTAIKAFMGTKQRDYNDWSGTGVETNQAVNANAIGLIINVDAQDGDTEGGQPRYLNWFYPIVNITPQFGNHAEAAAMDWPFTGSPTQSSKTMWGEAFTSANWGFTRAARYYLVSRYPLTQHTFIKNASTTTFTLDYAPASDHTGRAFWVTNTTQAGVHTQLTGTTDYTVVIATKTVTLTSAGTAGDVISVVYEATDLLV